MKEEFDLTRTEVRNTINAAETRPLTGRERSSLSAYLQPATHVVVNDEIRTLAASITGGETNRVLAARKLYDWTYKNVNYWVKDPEHLKASSVGSAEYCLRTKTGQLHGLPLPVCIAGNLLRHPDPHGLLGCDALYERGLVSVGAKGKSTSLSPATTTRSLATFPAATQASEVRRLAGVERGLLRLAPYPSVPWMRGFAGLSEMWDVQFGLYGGILVSLPHSLQTGWLGTDIR